MSLRTANLPEALKREVEKLSPENRLLLADAIWDEIEAEFEIAPPELTPEHRAILEARSAELDASPNAPRKSLDEILAKHGFNR
ncbi:MAG: addiction module protein [Alphaproteobacteria bacterium]|nr:addiction module protein [Alphaproteobacteria bacterium]MCW5740894.1 addiction module protein [Alphaproteobacteria bacterium]